MVSIENNKRVLVAMSGGNYEKINIRIIVLGGGIIA